MVICSSCGEVGIPAETMTSHASIDDICYRCMKDRRYNLSPLMTFEGTFMHYIKNPYHLKMDYNTWVKTYG